jgi:hypothetical protein
MAYADFLSFIRKAEKDPSLLKKLQEYVEPTTQSEADSFYQEIVGLGKSYGYNFTAAECAEAFKEKWADSEVQSLHMAQSHLQGRGICIIPICTVLWGSANKDASK